MDKIEELLLKIGLFHQKYLEQGVDVLIECLQCPEYLAMLDAMGGLKFTDLSPELQELEKTLGPKDLMTVSLFWNEYVGIGLLLLGEEAEMPCHDHPAMTVTTKVLKGEIQQINFDIVDLREQFDLQHPAGQRTCCCGIVEEPVSKKEEKPQNNVPPQKKILEAKVTSVEILSAEDIFNLTPVAHNVHTFRARQRSVLLKVLTPNYDQQFRFCNFYKLPQPLVPFPGAKVFLEYPTNGDDTPVKFLALQNALFQGDQEKKK